MTDTGFICQKLHHGDEGVQRPTQSLQDGQGGQMPQTHWALGTGTTGISTQELAHVRMAKAGR